jgi:PEP-CTERM motif
MRTLLVASFATLAASFSSASAAIVTETYSFSLGGFVDEFGDPPVSSPLATISGSFTLTFDPTLNHVDDTTGLVVHSFSGIGAPLDSPLGFSYVAASGEFVLGGLEPAPNRINAGTNDFLIFLNLANLSKPQFIPCSAPGAGCGAATGDPGFVAAAFARSGAGFDESAWIAATAESEVAAVPEPSTWAMMLAGFAGLGFMGWRGSRKTAALAA